jgi:integrase
VLFILHAPRVYGILKGEHMAKGQLLERADSNWLLRVYQGADPATGQRVYDNVPISGTRDLAAVELARRVAARPARPARNSALSEYLEWWLAIAVDPRLRTKTAKDYRAHLRRYAVPHLGERRLDALNPLDIQQAIAALSIQELSPRTVRYTHSILHRALEQAVDWQLIDRNPAASTSLPRNDRQEIVPLDSDQAARFIAQCERHPKGTIFLVAIATGLRPSEYLALRVRDIDFAESRIRVERTVERSGGRWIFPDTKRPRSRTVVIPGELLKRLELYCEKLGKRRAPERLLFETKHRAPIHERNLVQRAFKPILRMGALPDIRLYDLRHTFATLSLSAGLPARWVSEQLGHASVAFTLQAYGHLVCEVRRQSAERLGQLLFGPPVRRPAQSEIPVEIVEEEAG